jgi:hypothetical protein
MGDNPTNGNSPMITKEAVKIIFSEIEVISAYNAMFLSNLEKKLANWSPKEKLGDVFLKIVKFNSTF